MLVLKYIVCYIHIDYLYFGEKECLKLSNSLLL